MADVKVETAQSEKIPKPKKLIGVRHYQFVLMSITFFMSFGIRTSLSVAIISMTEEIPPDPSIPTYPEWDNTDTILSSFFWGYIIPQVAAGQLSEYYGPKWLLVGTMVIASAFHIAVPGMAAALGSTGVMICRIIQGLNQGFLFPCIHNMISKWSPLYERSMISNLVYGNLNLGIAVCMPVMGAICASTAGWPVAFYVYGALGIVWAMVFAIFAENSPSMHKSISEEEKNYIEGSNSVTHHATKKEPTPWISILTSLPVWAILVAGCATCWGGHTLLTEIPSYMSNMMKFDLNENSQLSAVPYFVQFFLGVVTAPLIDRMVEKKTVSITTSRKICNSLASFLPGAALIYLAFLEDLDATLVTVLFVVAVATSVFMQSGYLINVLDVAPNHAGTLLGIINGANNIFSILGPLSVGLLGSDKKDPLLWRSVFLLTAGIYIGTGLFYVLFTSAEVQSWNEPRVRKNVVEKDISNNVQTEKMENTKLSNC
ncbi:putative inorganic phosphate cotransporter isoform X1 [Tenebrio molitor]|uniref:putative inorganic phosphate cotransporter isoform X1 n=1 Tax=Tenebrio molitor TaxID=7067 RepID=UPI003624A09E